MFQTINIQNKKQFSGFTLVELLVSVAILGLIAVISVQSLYDSLSIRSKQQMIEESSDSVRLMIRLITTAVVQGKKVEVSSDGKQIKIVGELFCTTIKPDESEKAILLSTVPCDPPTADNFENISGDNVEISTFIASPTGTDVDIVNLTIEGKSFDSMGEHKVKYQTSITPRN